MSSSENSFEYIPGTCNIGPAEIGRRKRMAIYALILFFGMAIPIFLLTDNKLARLVLLFPACAFGVTGLQWTSKFCVRFGLKGIFNFGQLGTNHDVVQEEFRRKDLAKARSILLGGILIGLAITALAYFLPVLA